MRKLFTSLLALGLLLSARQTIAQTVVTITTGTAGAPISSVGPIMLTASGFFKASRYSYLYTQAELAAAGIVSGDVITSLGWMKSNAAPSLGGPAHYRIYMKNSSATAYAAATETWANLNAGATLVYENLTQVIPATMSPNYVDFTLNNSFTYTGGSLEIGTEWDASAVTGNPGTGELLWMWSTVPDRIYGTCQTSLTTLGALSSTQSNTTITDRRPFIQITYTPAVGGAPACVATPTAPADGGTACAGSTTLSWPAVTGATGYDVYMDPGVVATTLVSTNQPGTSYSTTTGSGPYAWRVVPRNAGGSATGCATFTFTAAATATPSVSIAANPAGAICAGTPVTFTATPTDGGPIPSYQWKLNGGNVGTGGNTFSTMALAMGDIVTAELTSSAACANPPTVTSNAISMTVNPSVVPSVSVTASPGTNVPAGTMVTFTATPVNGGAAPVYQWRRNGNVVGTNLNSYATNTLVNNDQVTVTMQSNAQCTNPASATSNPLTMTITTTSVGDVQSLLSGISIYPNPSSGTITVKGALAQLIHGERVKLELQSLLGQVIYSERLAVSGKDFEQEVVLPQAANGIYLLQLQYGDKKVEHRLTIAR